MQEGWIGNEYLVLFEPSELISVSERYGLDSSLPGFSIVGLRGWDDFIVRDFEGQLFTVPTLPLKANHLAPYELPSEQVMLRPDLRLFGKIKWYVKPLVFGGDPNADPNITWVTHEQHAELVRWWNNQYQILSS